MSTSAGLDMVPVSGEEEEKTKAQTSDLGFLFSNG